MTDISNLKATRQTRNQDAGLGELRTRLEEDLGLVIAHELIAAGAKSFYVIMASEVPSLQCHKLVGGFYHPAACYWFRPALASRFRGAGPCLFIAAPSNITPGDFISTAIHESAHAVLTTPMFATEDEPVVTERLTNIVKTPPKSWPAHQSASLPWRVRASAHSGAAWGNGRLARCASSL